MLRTHVKFYYIMDFHLQPGIFRNASKHGLDESAVLRQQAAKKKTEA